MKINTVWSHLYVVSRKKQKNKNTKLIEKEIRLVVARGGRGQRKGELEEGGQKIKLPVIK